MISARIPLSGTERVASAGHASGTAPDAIPLASGATAPQSVGAGGITSDLRGARVVIWTPPAPTTTEVDG